MYMELLDGIRGRIDGDGESIAVGIVSAIYQKRVHGGSRPVDRRVQSDRTARALLHVVIDVVNETAQLPWNRAWPQRNQGDNVARLQRQVRDALVIHAVSVRSIVGIHRRDGALHGDARVRIAEGELYIASRLLIDFERHALDFEIAEPLFRSGEGVRAGREPFDLVFPS